MIKPSIRAVLLGSITMENSVSQDALLVVLNSIISSELKLGGVGVGLIKTRYKLSSLYHIQGVFVSWICKGQTKFQFLHAANNLL